MRRFQLAAMSLLVALGVSACGGAAETGTPAAANTATAGDTPAAPAATATTGAGKPLTKVVVAMGYIPGVQFAPFYMAEDRGYYAAEGLQVEFKYGQVNDLLKVVAQGDIDFANVGGDEMVPAVSQGIPVRYVMTSYYHYPVAAAALAGGPALKQPADLKGRKIGIPGPYGSTYIGLRALLKVAGLQESDVQEQSIGFTQVAALQQRQVEVAMTYSMNEPVALESSGQKVQTLQVSDYMDLAAVGIATSAQKIAQKPDLVQAFVRATLKGTADTLRDPDAAFAASLKRTPELQGAAAETQRAVLRATLPFITPPAGRVPGSSDAQTWRTTESFLREIGLSKQPIDPQTLYTNQFTQAGAQ
jgi:NitT/TauT family transport system substrate-binding protein